MTKGCTLADRLAKVGYAAYGQGRFSLHRQKCSGWRPNPTNQIDQVEAETHFSLKKKNKNKNV